MPLVWAMETQEKFVRFLDRFSPFNIEGQSTSDIEVVEHMFQGRRWGFEKARKYDGLIEVEVRDHFREKGDVKIKSHFIKVKLNKGRISLKGGKLAGSFSRCNGN